MKYYAILTKWNGEKEGFEIQKEWIDDIVSAVEGQFFISNKENGITINGCDYANVKIYEDKKGILND